MSTALRDAYGALDLRGTVVVVTGAASGIGLALSRRFALEGAHVLMADVSATRIAGAVDGLREVGLDVEGVVTDVADESAMRELADRAFEAGRVAVVCLNAGIPGPLGERTWEIPISEWEPTLRVNLWGPIVGSGVFVPRLLAQDLPSHLIFTISMAGLFTSSVSAPYFASKHGAYALAAILRDQLASSELRVSAICPGAVQTPLLESIRSDMRNATERGSLPPDRRVDPRRATLAPSQVAKAVADAIGTSRFHLMLNPEYRHYYDDQYDAVRGEWADAPAIDAHRPAIERFLAALESAESVDLQACFRGDPAAGDAVACGLGHLPSDELVGFGREVRFICEIEEAAPGRVQISWRAVSRASGDVVASGVDVTRGDHQHVWTIETTRPLSLASIRK